MASVPLILLASSAFAVAFKSPMGKTKNQQTFNRDCRGVLTAQEMVSNESFDILGLSEEVTSASECMGWYDPTPVQKLSIPAILNMTSNIDENGGLAPKNDNPLSLWFEAPTGSGKTAGFTLPLLQILLDRHRPDARHEEAKHDDRKRGFISTLILCPTRELAAQTAAVIQELISHLPKKRRSTITVEVIHGGVPIEPQVTRLARKSKTKTDVDILIATPGRLLDVLRQQERVDPFVSAMERRIADAFDAKPKRRTKHRSVELASSLTLNDIQEMNLDKVDDDGRASLDDSLRNLDYLVLDEADRLLGGAFKDVNDLVTLLPRRQDSSLKTFLFSATFPEQTEERVNRFLSRLSIGVPLRVSTSAPPNISDAESSDSQLSQRQQKRMARITPTLAIASDSAPEIQLRAIRLNERDRTQALRFLLSQYDEWESVLVFVATRYATGHIARKLRRYGTSATELHGKLEQDVRQRRLDSFRKGKVRVLVSTDLAARGIDVENLSVVINYDLPRSAADFIHRIGRTGRAGKSGTAVSFVTAEKESHFDFIERSKLRGRLVEREILPGFEPNESEWKIQSAAEKISIPGTTHSQRGLTHDRIFGGIKGRRKSKKDKLREAAAKMAQHKGRQSAR